MCPDHTQAQAASSKGPQQRIADLQEPVVQVESALNELKEESQDLRTRLADAETKVAQEIQARVKVRMATSTSTVTIDHMGAGVQTKVQTYIRL